MKRSLIFDCDMGVKDAWALLVLLKGESLENSGPFESGYELSAITTVHGYSTMENCTENTIRLLNALGRSDIFVYKGCGAPLFPSDDVERNIDLDASRDEARSENWDAGVRTDALADWQYIPPARHPNPGFGQLQDPPELDTSIVGDTHAVHMMYACVRDRPGFVDFICTGPLTNLATCMMVYGESFIEKMGFVYVLGSNYSVKGQFPNFVEFNFKSDPEAASIVLSRTMYPITILPLETHYYTVLGNMTQSYRYSVLTQSNLQAIEFLTRVERLYELPRQRRRWYSADAILACFYAFHKQCSKVMDEGCFSVELQGDSRGVLKRSSKDGKRNAFFIAHFRLATYWEALRFAVDIRDDPPNSYAVEYENEERLVTIEICRRRELRDKLSQLMSRKLPSPRVRRKTL